MLRYWFHPSASGDIRVEARDERTCTLTVIDPTAGELERLGKFMVKARKKKMVANAAIGILPEGKTVLVLDCPVAEAGCLLAARSAPRGKNRGLLTAVRIANGEMLIAVADDAVTDLVITDKTTPVDEEPVAAVTVRRPTLCCPNPIPGPDRRASQVLRAFTTAKQWASWMKNGWLVAVGNLSGHRYQLVHRHHLLAIERGKIGWDMEDRNIVHAYDWSVPAAEEVLAMKLVLENREHWIRNPSGYFGRPGPIYHNPFVPDNEQVSDGIIDAALVSSIGMNAQIYGKMFADQPFARRHLVA